MNKLRMKRKSRILLYRFYKSINIASMLSLIFYTSMVGVFFVPNNVDAGGDKYTLCHATGSATNPWVRINVPESALSAHLVDEHGSPLSGHESDVFLGIDNDNILQCPTPIGTVTGVKFNDLDGDRNWDIAEPMLPGWTIQLKYHWDDASPFTEEVTTAFGYNFGNVPFGSYWVCEVQQTGWEQTRPIDNHGCYNVTLDAEHPDSSLNHFGNYYPICGNNIKDSGEECDDGNNLDNDGCSAVCLLESCGDSVKQISEDCDDGPAGSTTCTDKCQWKHGWINTQKVICDDETDLPNWNDNSVVIDSSTASDFVTASSGHCQVNYSWAFQFKDSQPGATWTTMYNASDFPEPNQNVEIRETIDESLYIPFSNDENDNNSAVLYCNGDTSQNYDNLEQIYLQPGQTHLCIAFNAVKPVCGNDILESGEVCDDGNASNDDACLNSCASATCGDGYTEAGVEDCDDGNASNEDACLNNCTNFQPASIKVCKMKDYDGDSNTTNDQTPVPGWEFTLEKDGNYYHGAGAEADGCYTFENLGPGQYEVFEQTPPTWTPMNPTSYDFGQVTTGGYYEYTFVNYKIPVCGNDELEYGEVCEIGDTQACTTTDGYAGVQSCNVAPTQFIFGITMINGDALGDRLPVCDWNPCVTDESCGDGEVNGLEACDDGNTNDDDTCKNDCTVNTHTCGNGILQEDLGEQCDDGNLISYDGCSAVCQNEIPQITLTKTDTPDPVKAGDNITYTLAYTVAGMNLTGLTLVDTLPSNTTFVSASDSGVYDSATNKVTWNLGNKAIGSYSVALTVKVAGVIANGTILTNTAVLDSNETEPYSDTETTTINSGAVLTIVKSLEKSPVYPGDSVNYIVTIKNTGSDTAYNLRLADTMPAGFTYDDGSAGSWFFGDLAVGEEKNFIYSVTVGTSVVPGTYTNTAQVSADNVAAITATANLDVIAKPGAVLGAETEGTVAASEETLPAAGSNMSDYLMYLLVIAVAAFGTYGLRKVAVVKK
ncbi:MAG: DUF4215 domain-containing protein [Patescibacteria group bacterium]